MAFKKRNLKIPGTDQAPSKIKVEGPIVFKINGGNGDSAHKVSVFLQINGKAVDIASHLAIKTIDFSQITHDAIPQVQLVILDPTIEFEGDVVNITQYLSDAGLANVTTVKPDRSNVAGSEDFDDIGGDWTLQEMSVMPIGELQDIAEVKYDLTEVPNGTDEERRGFYAEHILRGQREAAAEREAALANNPPEYVSLHSIRSMTFRRMLELAARWNEYWEIEGREDLILQTDCLGNSAVTRRDLAINLDETQEEYYGNEDMEDDDLFDTEYEEDEDDEGL